PAETGTVHGAMLPDRAGTLRGPIAGWIVGQTIDAYQIPGIPEGCRHAPGNGAVVAPAHARVARIHAALYTILRALQMHMMPVGGARNQRHMGIVAVQRLAAGSAGTGHCPVV